MEKERLARLDTLRGFALCGVFISNVMVWFSGRVFLPREQVLTAMNNASLADTVTWQAFSVLVGGKFLTLFSFLFGFGFAVQMGRAEARGASITPLYVRRLAVMLVMGSSTCSGGSRTGRCSSIHGHTHAPPALRRVGGARQPVRRQLPR